MRICRVASCVRSCQVGFKLPSKLVVFFWHKSNIAMYTVAYLQSKTQYVGSWIIEWVYNSSCLHCIAMHYNAGMMFSLISVSADKSMIAIGHCCGCYITLKTKRFWALWVHFESQPEMAPFLKFVFFFVNIYLRR